MEIDKDKIDETVLALLYLTTFDDKYSVRAWKGHDWDSLDRLYEKGLISNPKSKAKSVVMSEEGVKLSEELFRKMFEKKTKKESRLVYSAKIGFSLSARTSVLRCENKRQTSKAQRL